jgi:predicted TIM-barrel fold metal-dependent hydrolase
MKMRVYHGLIADAYGPQMIPLSGADRVLWGSDFPHIRFIGLEAQEHVHKLVGGLPSPDRERVVGGNVAKMFNLDQVQLTPPSRPAILAPIRQHWRHACDL